MMKRAAFCLITVLLTLLPLDGSQAYAASATMSLSPGANQVAKGSYLTVYVRENSGSEPVNGVQANVNYPASLLQYVSISSSSAFGITAQNSGGNGLVSIGRGALPAVSGSQLIASVLFKALVDSDTASLTFTGGSSVISANSNADIAAGKSGASISLTAPAQPAPKDTTPPTITAVSVKDIHADKATVSWTTSEAATSEVDYGLDTRYGLSAAAGGLTTSHSMLLDSPLLAAGTVYHFVVKSADQAGNAATSSDATFSTTGTDIVVLVTDTAMNRPLAGARVSRNGQTATTDTRGRATLTNLPGGTTTIVVRAGNSTVAETVVIGPPASSPQLVAFKIVLAGTGMPWWAAVALVGALVILTNALSFLSGKGRLRWPNRLHTQPGARPVSTEVIRR